MKKQMIAALFALGCGLSLTSLAVANEGAKSEDNKPMYMAKCPPSCDFTVKSHDKAEVVAMLQEHARTHHNGMVVSDEKAESMIKVVEPK